MNKKELYKLECEIKKEFIIIRNERKDVDYKMDKLFLKISRLVVSGAEMVQKEKEEKEKNKRGRKRNITNKN